MSPRGCKDESKRSESDEGNEVREKDRKANNVYPRYQFFDGGVRYRGTGDYIAPSLPTFAT